MHCFRISGNSFLGSVVWRVVARVSVNPLYDLNPSCSGMYTLGGASDVTVICLVCGVEVTRGVADGIDSAELVAIAASRVSEISRISVVGKGREWGSYACVLLGTVRQKVGIECGRRFLVPRQVAMSGGSRSCPSTQGGRHFKECYGEPYFQMFNKIT